MSQIPLVIVFSFLLFSLLLVCVSPPCCLVSLLVFQIRNGCCFAMWCDRIWDLLEAVRMDFVLMHSLLCPRISLSPRFCSSYPPQLNLFPFALGFFFCSFLYWCSVIIEYAQGWAWGPEALEVCLLEKKIQTILPPSGTWCRGEGRLE